MPISSTPIAPSAKRPDKSTTGMSKNKTYTLQTKLKGHTGLVLCMSITEDGKLASGGMDGVRVWDLRDILASQIPESWRASQFSRPSGAGDRGATTSLAWIRREDEPDDGLIYGTASGYVVCWKEVNTGRDTAYEESYCARTANPSEVTAISYDSGSNRLAVSNRNSLVSLFRVGPKVDLHPIFTIVIKDHIPKALAFSQSGNSQKDIYSFGIHDGVIYTLSGKDGKIKDTRQTGCRIGNVSANIRRGVFCVDDPAQGAALYRYHSWDRVRTYPVTVEKSMRPRQVAFVEDCKFILSGSDHGVVYIFDRRSGKMVDELKSGKGRIQALTATEHTEKPTIFSAMSFGEDDACDISIWQRNLDTPEKKPHIANNHQSQTSTWFSLLFAIIQISFLFMAMGFLWQNTSIFDSFLF